MDIEDGAEAIPLTCLSQKVPYTSLYCAKIVFLQRQESVPAFKRKCSKLSCDPLDKNTFTYCSPVLCKKVLPALQLGLYLQMQYVGLSKPFKVSAAQHLSAKKRWQKS
jgi:hypothetical protein